MSAGFQVINDSGYTQIDENYANLFFVASGSISMVARSTSVTGLTLYNNTVTYNGALQSPIVFVRCLNYYCQVLGVTVGASSTQISIAANGADTVQYYIFDKMPNDSSGNFGLQVFDASGRITFNSNYKPMRIKTVAKIPDGRLTTTTGLTISTDAGTYAAATGFRKIEFIQTGTPVPGGSYYSQGFTDGFKITSTGLVTTAFTATTIPAASSNRQDTGGLYMLVKVDGL